MSPGTTAAFEERLTQAIAAQLLFMLIGAYLLVKVPAPAANRLAPEPQAEASEPQDCFWTSVFDEENGNLFYPDSGVNYYLGRVNLPEDTGLRFAIAAINRAQLSTIAACGSRSSSDQRAARISAPSRVSWASRDDACSSACFR